MNLSFLNQFCVDGNLGKKKCYLSVETVVVWSHRIVIFAWFNEVFLEIFIEFPFDGFTSDTCRSLVAMKDVSFLSHDNKIFILLFVMCWLSLLCYLQVVGLKCFNECFSLIDRRMV